MEYLELVSGNTVSDIAETIVHLNRNEVVNVVSQSNDSGYAETYNNLISIEAVKIMDIKIHAESQPWTTPYAKGDDCYYECEIENE